MMNILITGANGFVGSNFIANNRDFNIKEVDLINQNFKDIDLNNIDAILHLAALVHQMNGAPEENYFKINSELAYQTALISKQKGVKHFVLMSTVKVYGESTTGKLPWNENSECLPLDPYGKSKLDAEKRIKELEDANFTVSIVRSPLVYGPKVKGNMINLIKLVSKYPILPFGKINNKRNMVYVGNLNALIKSIIFQKKSGVFLASDRFPLSTTDLIILIRQNLHRNVVLITIPPFFVKVLSLLLKNLVDRLWGSLEIDNSKTCEILNFSPPFTSDDGIKDMISWYKMNKI